MEPIDTKKVTGRREVRYQTVDDILADAEQLARGEVVTLGNWSFGQILEHIARVMRGGIEGVPITVPWWIKPILRMMKGKILRDLPPAGYRLRPAARQALVPPADTTVERGLQLLREAMRRWKEDPTRQPSPFLGKLTNEEWDLLQMRHAELHMSFVKPASEADSDQGREN